jgi:protein MAK11
MDGTERVHVAVGTYEGGLVGWEWDGGAPEMRLVYAFRAHDGVVHSLSCGGPGGRFLVSGSEDEHVSVCNVGRRQQECQLGEHRAAVTATAFAGPGHAMTGDVRGNLSLWRAGEWGRVHVIAGAHAGRVESISVHPSGRAALTVGADRTVALWDLARGKKAFGGSLASAARSVSWSDAGDLFAVVDDEGVCLFDGKSGALKTRLACPVRAHAAALVVEGGRARFAVVGCDDATIRVFDASTGAVHASIDSGHERRIKCLTLLPANSGSSSGAGGGAGGGAAGGGGSGVAANPLSQSLVVTADSGGQVRLWGLASLLAARGEDATVPALAKLEAAKGARITALAATRYSVATKKRHDKRPREDADEEEAGKKEVGKKEVGKEVGKEVVKADATGKGKEKRSSAAAAAAASAPAEASKGDAAADAGEEAEARPKRKRVSFGENSIKTIPPRERPPPVPQRPSLQSRKQGGGGFRAAAPGPSRGGRGGPARGGGRGPHRGGGRKKF